MSALNFNGESGKPSSLHCLKMSICVFLHTSQDFAWMGSGIPTKVSQPLEPKECRRQERAGEEGEKKKHSKKRANKLLKSNIQKQQMRLPTIPVGCDINAEQQSKAEPRSASTLIVEA